MKRAAKVRCPSRRKSSRIRTRLTLMIFDHKFNSIFDIILPFNRLCFFFLKNCCQFSHLFSPPILEEMVSSTSENRLKKIKHNNFVSYLQIWRELLRIIRPIIFIIKKLTLWTPPPSLRTPLWQSLFLRKIRIVLCYFRSSITQSTKCTKSIWPPSGPQMK